MDGKYLAWVVTAVALLVAVTCARADIADLLPPALQAAAVADSAEYDEEFDYVKLGKYQNLRLFPQGWTAARQLVDLVVVNKRHHQMLLYKGDRLVRSFWVALSPRVEGPKRFEGDRRTPEGTYRLDYRKETSSYYKAFHISYPNPDDIAYARQHGRRPGGMIMIHGQPPSRGEYQETVQRSDWTNGCIALLNPDLDEFLSLVDVGTPITINP